MNKPTTYAEWSECIDIFETGEQDDSVVLAMSLGSLNWNSGVAPLFSERISSAFNLRLQRCADRMEREFKTRGDETTIVRALLDARRTLMLLHCVATIPSFPDMLRDHLTGEIRRYAERSQQSLEDSAKHDRSGRLASLMRNNSLLHFETKSNPIIFNPAPSPEAPQAFIARTSTTDVSSNAFQTASVGVAARAWAKRFMLSLAVAAFVIFIAFVAGT